VLTPTPAPPVNHGRQPQRRDPAQLKNCGTANGTIVRPWQELDNTCRQWKIAP